MNLDSATIIALASLATALFVGVTGWRTARSQAEKDKALLSVTVRKDEVSLLRGELARLHLQQLGDEARITQLEQERNMLIDDISVLWQYAATLRALMIIGGVKDVPAMPSLRSVSWDKMSKGGEPTKS